MIAGNFGQGIVLRGTSTGSDRNTIAGNYIGVDASGATAAPNTENGIEARDNSSSNLIGTNADGIFDAAERNIVSGNAGAGIRVTNGAATNNTIAGNYIGIDAAGTTAVPNNDGISISFAASENLIGTDGDGTNDVAERNVI